MFILNFSLFSYRTYFCFCLYVRTIKQLKVEDDLQHIHDASNQEELVHFYKQYGKDIIDLSQHAQRRQYVKSFIFNSRSVE